MRLMVTGLCKAYPGLTVLDHADLAVAAGEVVAVQGASGTGKSTLLHCLGLIDRPDAGSIALDGEVLTTLNLEARAAVRARRIGFVFQGFHLLPEFTVAENILMAARTAGLDLAEGRRRAQALLDEVGLGGRGASDVRILSGGERQRVALCRALLNQPQLLLADEPTGNLDPGTATRVMDALIAQSRLHGASLVLVTHSEAAARRADRVLHLSSTGCTESAQA